MCTPACRSAVLASSDDASADAAAIDLHTQPEMSTVRRSARRSHIALDRNVRPTAPARSRSRSAGRAPSRSRSPSRDPKKSRRESGRKKTAKTAAAAEQGSGVLGLIGAAGDAATRLTHAFFPGSATARVALLATVLVSAGHGVASAVAAAGPRAQPSAYPLLTVEGGATATYCTIDYIMQGQDWLLLGLVVPVLVFGAADLLLGTSGTAVWAPLGKMDSIEPMSTCEPPRPGRLLLRASNAHSSHAQIAGGVFILAKAWEGARAPLASGFLGASLLLVRGFPARAHPRPASRRRCESLQRSMSLPRRLTAPLR